MAMKFATSPARESHLGSASTRPASTFRLAGGSRLRSRGRLAVLVTTLVVALVASGLTVSVAGAGANSSWAHCGDAPGSGAGWGNVRALHTRCHKARHVARHYWRTWFHGHPDHRFRGWHCRDRQVGEELWKARCARTQRSDVRQKVRFEFGF